MATPVNLTIEHQDSSRTGLVSSFGGHQRSYGTVKEHTGPTYRTDTQVSCSTKYKKEILSRGWHLSTV